MIEAWAVRLSEWGAVISSSQYDGCADVAQRVGGYKTGASQDSRASESTQESFPRKALPTLPQLIMAPTVYLVSGANRGIGLGFVVFLAARPDTIVFAGARNPDAASDLKALASKYSNKVHIVELVAADKAGNEAAVAEIKRVAGRLDVVIANAGLGNFIGSILETTPEAMREHYEVCCLYLTSMLQTRN